MKSPILLGFESITAPFRHNSDESRHLFIVVYGNGGTRCAYAQAVSRQWRILKEELGGTNLKMVDCNLGTHTNPLDLYSFLSSLF